MTGILLVDKPAGWTSFDVVNYVRKCVASSENLKLRQIKVGHSGTLDPFATGLLILFIGKSYTKRASEFSKLDKTYEISLRLGFKSTTGDPEGELQPVSDKIPNIQEIKRVLKTFLGESMQVPPAFSAIKIDGKRAYKLAREGKPVTIEPRIVKISRLDLIDYHYPDVTLIAEVSSGTYIRSLVEDIGNILDTGAYTVQLRRSWIKDYSVLDSVQVENITDQSVSKLLNLLPDQKS